MLMRLPAIILVCLCISCLCLPTTARAQAGSDLQRVIERLDRLEKQNQELQTEVQELRRQLDSSQQTAVAQAETPWPPDNVPPPAERLDVQESRTDELAQSKVGTSQRMPVALTGMVLFNAFHNGGFGGALQEPVTAQLNQSAASSGATFRQTVIGLRFNGPDLPGGGKATGSAYFDFWGGTASPGNNLFRVRLATIDLTWKNFTITAGQDKPIVSPREPMSLAQVGLAPLSGAGNLWDWQPQIRVERRFGTSETGVRAQAGIYETAEAYPGNAPAALSGTLERQRPAYEGRLLFYHGSEKKRLEIAPGYHFSNSHVSGQSVESELVTLDWLIKPSDLIEITGAFFRGTDDAGLGALRQGFTILPTGRVIPVHATGGWSQISVFPTSRLSLNIFGGQEADRASDLVTNSVRRNLSYAGNIVYKLAPNVLAAIEASQTRTDYISAGLRRNNHYDLALAYLF
jgi:hypothetical protein